MTFVPDRQAIIAITQANPCVVTTEDDHNLTTAQIVRIHVPKNFGMFELDQKLFSVTPLSSDTFSLQITQIPPAINVNSTEFTPFVIPSNPQFTAEVISVGSGPTPLNHIPWSAINDVCSTLLGDATVNNSTSEIPF